MRGALEIDPELTKIVKDIKEGKEFFSFSNDGVLRINSHVCAPKDEELRKEIVMSEISRISLANNNTLFIH